MALVSRRSRSVLALLALTAVAAGCSGGSDDKPRVNKPFCDAAGRYEKELERQFEDNVVDVDRQVEIVQDLADAAPKQIRAKAERFLDALQRVEEEPQLRDDPAVREAVEDVNRYAAQGCGVYDRRSGI
jgi:uncharacterized protein (UPF0147 family)